ncbi:hypothetical protein CRP738_gp56 [Roseobacter phage CRP-738]|nr:hypothetical protein CRP738_gp56 [Roseobacter phage CRP-738]
MIKQFWIKGQVKLSDLFIGDPQSKIRDAVANTEDYELLTAFAAKNRLIAYLRRDTVTDADEIDHYCIERNIMEEALAVRLRAAKQRAAG